MIGIIFNGQVRKSGPGSFPDLHSDLDLLMQNSTTVIVAHRLSTIKVAHRIAVLDQGRIMELGTHKEPSVQRKAVSVTLMKHLLGSSQSETENILKKAFPFQVEEAPVEQ